MASATSPRQGYVPKYQAAGGAKVNAVSTRAISPPPPEDAYSSNEVRFNSQPTTTNNNTMSSALLDSGSSVNTVPHPSLLTSFVPLSGLPLTAANGSPITTLGHGSYSPHPNLTLPDTLLSLALTSQIFSVSSLTHDHNKIVVFSDSISCVIPNTSINHHKLRKLVASSSSIEDPINISFATHSNIFPIPNQLAHRMLSLILHLQAAMCYLLQYRIVLSSLLLLLKIFRILMTRVHP